MVSNHGDRKSPKDRAVGPLPYMAMKMAYKWGWSDHHLHPLGAHPPSGGLNLSLVCL